MINWVNLLVYIGIFIVGALFWYFIVYYVRDWLGL